MPACGRKSALYFEAMATTSAANTYSKVDLESSTPAKDNNGYPRFGMNTGTRVIPGQIMWKGKYIDEAMFFKVSQNRPEIMFLPDLEIL